MTNDRENVTPAVWARKAWKRASLFVTGEVHEWLQKCQRI
jgi:hypothetical protein